MDIKALRLMINALRRAELDFLTPGLPENIRSSARTFLFGVKESPLPGVCRALGINVSAARLTLLQWRSSGKIGDPIFDFLTDPSNVVRAESGAQLISRPNFESLYARTGTNEDQQKRSKGSS